MNMESMSGMSMDSTAAMTGMASMTMSSMGMDTSPTATGSAAAAATSGGGMDMMDMMSKPGTCQISMLWNWTVIDACFIARSWRITSRGMFAGSCIGVVLLVCALEFLRRAGKEFDRYLVRQYEQKKMAMQSTDRASSGTDSPPSGKAFSGSKAAAIFSGSNQGFRPNVWQQAIRALIHMVQFGVAYFVMLLAMYYNGFIIICILLGAFIGSFIFNWEDLKGPKSKNDAIATTVCCG